MRLHGILAATFLLASGCQLYFGGNGNGQNDDDAIVCPATMGPVSDDAVLVRNPETGQCVTPPDVGCGGFDPTPDNQPGSGGGTAGSGTTSGGTASGSDGTATGGVPAQGGWPACDSTCTGLDETTCEATSACRAIYVDTCFGTHMPCVDVHYAACWPTSTFGPITGGQQCLGLDAGTCSMHDDCSAVHQPQSCPAGAPCPYGALGDFISCQPERRPPPPPACPTLDEATCISRSDCAPLYQGSQCSCSPSGCVCQQQAFVSCTEGAAMGGTCGPYTCTANEYCMHGEGGAYPGVNTFACQPMPATCGANATCDCLKNEPCGYQCAADASGGLTLTCLYP